nr:EOG090X0KWJ [Eurycercus lamellatus]
MAAMSWYNFCTSSRLFRIQSTWNVQHVVGYAKNVGAKAQVPALGKKLGKGKMMAIVEKKVFPVVTDADKLVNFVCGSNVLKQGQDIQLKPDNEYPDWLWTLRLEKPPPLEEMDQNSLAYWKRLRKLNLQRQAKLMRLRKY